MKFDPDIEWGIDYFDQLKYAWVTWCKEVGKQVTNDAMPERANVVVLVAHPDDETLWAGGTLLMQRGWTTFVGTLCRARDEDRAPKFFRALDMLGAKGAMADLDDEPAQVPLDEDKVRETILSLVPSETFD